MKRGFSLIEILIAMAVLVIVAGIGGGYFINLVKKIELDQAGNALVADIKDARSRALAGESDLHWGIHAARTATSSFYQLFSTPSNYANASTVITTFLPSSVAFTAPAQGNTLDVIFIRGAGNTTSTSLSMFSSSVNATRTITVSTSGNVN